MTIGNNNFSFMNNYREVMSLMRSAFGTSKFNDEDMVVFFGAILLLRKHDSLLLNYVGNKEEGEDIKEIFIEAGYRLSYSVERIKEIASNKEDFIRFIDDVLSIARVAENKRNLLTAITTFNCDDFQEDDYLDVFDTAIAELSYSNRVVFQQPRELSELVACLVGDGMETVFDPFGGLMDFATTMKDKMFIAYEIHGYTYDLARLRLALAGVYDHCFLLRKNAEEWIPRNDFNYIITNPPYGPKLRMYDSRTEESAELVALNRFESTTREDGQLIAILPQSVLSNEQKKVQKLRETITQKNWLDTIICLPNNILPFSRMATAIVVLKKQRDENAPIKLVDASSCYVGKERQLAKIDVDAIKELLPQKEFEFTKEEILEQHASWNVQWYLERRNTVFSEGYTVVELSEVMASVKPCRHFDETKGRVVNVTSLSSDVYRYEKSVDDFPESSDLKGTTKVTEPVLLLSLIGVPKPTYCSASAETPIFLKSDVCAYRVVNKTVHLGYLCMELAKRLKATKGTVIPRLSKAQILQTRVEFPSLDDQRSLFEQKNLFDDEKQKAMMGEVAGFQDSIAKIKREYKESIRGRKHAVGQYLSDVSAYWNVLNSFRKEKNGCLIDTDIVDEDYQMTVGGLFCAIDKKLNCALEQMETLLSDENEWEGLDLDEIEPDGFIEEYIKTNNDVRFNFVHGGFDLVEYDTMQEEIELEYWSKILFPTKVLKRVFEDIIKNAVEYGFTDSRRKDYKVLISQKFIDIDRWEIRIANNGEPVPNSLDPKKVFNLGYTTGLGKGHTGIGAYEVKQLMEMYGGEVEFVSTPDEEYTVTYVLTFKNTNIE